MHTTELYQGLDQRLAGRVTLPTDATFDEERRPWNLAIDQQVEAVVHVADEHDVSEAVRFARRSGIGVTVQPNGHGATGRTRGSLLLRTRALDRVEVDPDRRVARIGAGVSSGALQAAVARHGLTGLPGSSPVVSVAGVVTGGGLSWFARSFGWVADSVTALTAVAADGDSVHVDAESDPDLFFALRGGGGGYAIITELEVALAPAPQLQGGRLLWGGEHTRAVAHAFRDVTRTAPPELTLWLELLHFPGAEPMVAIDATFLGTAADAEAALAGLRSLPAPLQDTLGPISPADVGSITADPTDPGAGASRAELLTDLEDPTLDSLLDAPIAPLLSVQVRHLGGAISSPSSGPHGPVPEPYALYLFGLAPDAGTASAVVAKQTGLVEHLPTSGRKPVTFLNPQESLAHALPSDALDRLRRIKQDRDPTDTVRSAFPFTGAPAEAR